MCLFPRRVLYVFLSAVVISLSVLAISTTDIWAQTGDAPVGIDDLRDEREQNAREAALAVQGIDVVTATVDELAAALDEMQAFVDIQQIRLEEAEARYEASVGAIERAETCLLYTSPSPRDATLSRMPSSA